MDYGFFRIDRNFPNFFVFKTTVFEKKKQGYNPEIISLIIRKLSVRWSLIFFPHKRQKKLKKFIWNEKKDRLGDIFLIRDSICMTISLYTPTHFFPLLSFLPFSLFFPSPHSFPSYPPEVHRLSDYLSDIFFFHNSLLHFSYYYYAIWMLSHL